MIIPYGFALKQQLFHDRISPGELSSLYTLVKRKISYISVK